MKKKNSSNTSRFLANRSSWRLEGKWMCSRAKLYSASSRRLRISSGRNSRSIFLAASAWETALVMVLFPRPLV